MESHAVTHATTTKGSININRQPLAKITDDVIEEHQSDQVENGECENSDDVIETKMSNDEKDQNRSVPTKSTSDNKSVKDSADDVRATKSEAAKKSNKHLSSELKFRNSSEPEKAANVINKNGNTRNSTSISSSCKTDNMMTSPNCADDEIKQPPTKTSIIVPKCQINNRERSQVETTSESKQSKRVNEQLKRATSKHSDFSSTFSSTSSSRQAVQRKGSKNEDLESSATAQGTFSALLKI